MTNLVESSNWDSGVYQFATTDPIQGGPGGIDNQPHQSLTDRSLWLRNRIGACITQAGLAEGTTDNQQLVESVVLHVANIAALRAAPIPVVPAGQPVLIATRGQVSVNDGLSSLYSWSSTSTAVDDGISVVKPASNPASGRWLRAGINAQSLGGQAVGYFASAAAVNAALALLAPINNPTFTGKAQAPAPQPPLLGGLPSDYQIANTQWVSQNFVTASTAAFLYLTISGAASEYLALSGGTATGHVSLNAGGSSYTYPTTENDTTIATTAFVHNVLASYANLGSPSFYGTPSGPTPPAGDVSTRFATTQFVAAAISPGSSLGQTGYRKNADGTITQWGLAAAQAASPGSAIYFPIRFPNAVFSVTATAYGGAATVAVLNQYTNYFSMINGIGGYCTWHAEGF